MGLSVVKPRRWSRLQILRCNTRAIPLPSLLWVSDLTTVRLLIPRITSRSAAPGAISTGIHDLERRNTVRMRDRLITPPSIFDSVLTETPAQHSLQIGMPRRVDVDWQLR
jgi:hypothetical protein